MVIALTVDGDLHLLISLNDQWSLCGPGHLKVSGLKIASVGGDALLTLRNYQARSVTSARIISDIEKMLITGAREAFPAQEICIFYKNQRAIKVGFDIDVSIRRRGFMCSDLRACHVFLRLRCEQVSVFKSLWVICGRLSLDDDVLLGS